MTQPANSTTTKPRLQENVVNTTLLFNTIRQNVGDIESQVVATKSLGELCFEQLDRIGGVINDQAGLSAVLCLDALLKAVLRNVELIQDAVELAGGALLEGGAA